MKQILVFSRRHVLASAGGLAAAAGAALYVLVSATPAHACDGGNYNFNYNYNSNTNFNSNSNSNSNSSSSSVTIRHSVSG